MLSLDSALGRGAAVLLLCPMLELEERDVSKCFRALCPAITDTQGDRDAIDIIDLIWPHGDIRLVMTPASPNLLST